MSYDNPRINDLGMSMMDIVTAMSEGNPSAVTVIAQVIQSTEAIDPDNALGPLGTLTMLDTLDLYDSQIWILYKDICGENIENFIGVLRATQLGILPGSQVTDIVKSIDSYDPLPVSFDVDEVVGQVKDQLPAFGLQTA